MSLWTRGFDCLDPPISWLLHVQLPSNSTLQVWHTVQSCRRRKPSYWKLGRSQWYFIFSGWGRVHSSVLFIWNPHLLGHVSSVWNPKLNCQVFLPWVGDEAKIWYASALRSGREPKTGIVFCVFVGCAVRTLAKVTTGYDAETHRQTVVTCGGVLSSN